MTTRATGTFQVKLEPKASNEVAEGSPLARLSIDKTFTGDIDGTSVGEMLSAGTVVKGSAGYVAIERVVGTVHGRRGTFALMHTGVMNRGTPQLSVIVVPDSGTGELTGLRGTFDIDRSNGQHAYVLEYTIDA